MSSRKTEKMWAVLLESGLVQGAAPQSKNLESPWYVKVLLAFCGWLAALFLLGFVSIGFEFVFESSIAMFIVGGVSIAGSFSLLKMPKNEFFEHLALALSLAGQVLIVFGIFKAVRTNDEMSWFLVAILQAGLAILIPNYIHRVWSSFAAAMAAYVALFLMGAPYLLYPGVMFLAAWLWLNEFSYPAHMRKIRAIAYGQVLAMILVRSTELFSPTMIRSALPKNPNSVLGQPWLGELLAGMVVFYVVWQLLERAGQLNFGRVAVLALGGTLVICAVSLEAHAISLGMVIMLLGFSGGNRVLFGLGAVSLLLFMSSYYYMLEITLLAKSQTLFMVGLVLLSLRWLKVRLISAEKEAAGVE